MNKSSFFAPILSFIFPKICPFCDSSIQEQEEVCKGCNRHLTLLECPIKTVGAVTPTKVVTLYPYSSVPKAGLLSAKYHSNFVAARFFAKQMVKRLEEMGYSLSSFDGLVLLPSGKSNEEHLKQIASFLSRKGHLPILKKILFRFPGARPQHELSAQERLSNAATLFGLKEKSRTKAKGKRLLLLDDVMTTGASMDNCARLLILSGAKEVVGATICRTEKSHLFPEKLAENS